MNLTDRFERILAAAVRAPSGDNSQPWKFHVSENSISVEPILGVDNQILNYGYLGTYLSTGAVLESIDISARSEGLTPRYMSPKNSESLAASIAFQPCEVDESAEEYVQLMYRRHTNRKAYAKRDIPASDLHDMITKAEKVGVRIVSVTDPSKIAEISKSLVAMEEIALSDKRIHKLFFDDIIFDRRAHEHGDTGLYIRSLELPPPVRGLFRLIKYWPVARALSGFLPKAAAMQNAVVYSKSSALVMFFAEHADQASALQMGRSVLRFWLEATKHGVSVQPVSGLFYLKLRAENDPTFFDNKTVAKIMDAYNAIMMSVGDTSGVPLMLMRVGYADAPTEVSRRREPYVIPSPMKLPSERFGQIQTVLHKLYGLSSSDVSFALQENISFFRASDSMMKFARWLWKRRTYTRAEELLEINELLPDLDHEMHDALTAIERQPFPGMLKPAVATLVSTARSCTSRYRSVDLGCGAMELERQMMQAFSTDDKPMTIVGVDTSERALDRAQVNIESLERSDIRVHRVDVLDSSSILNLENAAPNKKLVILWHADVSSVSNAFKNAFFDIAYSCLALHHIPESQRSEIIDVSKRIASCAMHYDGFRSALHFIPQTLTGWKRPVFLNAVILSNLRFPNKRTIGEMYPGAKIDFFSHGHYRAVFSRV